MYLYFNSLYLSNAEYTDSKREFDPAEAHLFATLEAANAALKAHLASRCRDATNDSTSTTKTATAAPGVDKVPKVRDRLPFALLNMCLLSISHHLSLTLHRDLIGTLQGNGFTTCTSNRYCNILPRAIVVVVAFVVACCVLALTMVSPADSHSLYFRGGNNVFFFNPLARANPASYVGVAGAVYLNGKRYIPEEFGSEIKLGGKTIGNACFYTTTYACLNAGELTRFPTVDRWRTAVLNELRKGHARTLVEDALARGVDMYGQKTVEDYIKFMLENSAMAGSLELQAAIQLLNRPAFQMVVNIGMGIPFVHSARGPDGNTVPAVNQHLIYLRASHYQLLKRKEINGASADPV